VHILKNKKNLSFLIKECW